jgi:hypothetical protein
MNRRANGKIVVVMYRATALCIAKSLPAPREPRLDEIINLIRQAHRG